MLDPINSLWWGPFSTMEKLCMNSYLRNGHPFLLWYYYERPVGVPAGVQLCNGEEIMPAPDWTEFVTFAHFADLFRYSLLYQRGGWWVDMDTVCLRSFEGWPHIVIPEQEDRDGGFAVNNAYLRIPIKSELAKWLADKSELLWRAKKDKLEWDVIGPRLCLQAVAKFSLGYQPYNLYNPIPWWKYSIVLEPDGVIPANAFAIHLWHAMWKSSSIPVDQTGAPTSIYAKLQRMYLGG